MFPVLAGINISNVIYLVCNTGADTRSTNNPHTNDISLLVTFDESSLRFQTNRTISAVTTATWQNISTNLSDSDGLWQFTDTNANLLPSHFCRSSTR
ncbi:MAG: hypothetical protein ABSG04_00265 [Verrucomicrobiota bacterium]